MPVATPKVTAALAIILWCSLVFTKNGYDAATDIFYGKASNYNQQMVGRYEQIKEAVKAGRDTIYFEAISNPPHTVFVWDITADPQHWLNRDYAFYFGLGDKKIMLRKF